MFIITFKYVNGVIDYLYAKELQILFFFVWFSLSLYCIGSMFIRIRDKPIDIT